MKALIKFLLGILFPLTVFGIWSCENRNDPFAGKGKAEFSLSMPEEGTKVSFRLFSRQWYNVISYLGFDRRYGR